jgi:hypothetical protein
MKGSEIVVYERNKHFGFFIVRSSRTKRFLRTVLKINTEEEADNL